MSQPSELEHLRGARGRLLYIYIYVYVYVYVCIYIYIYTCI